MMPRKKSLKEEISEEIRQIDGEDIRHDYPQCTRCTPEISRHNVQDVLQKFQDTKNKEHETTQKQIKELKEDFHKYQSETTDIIKK
jgi:hypothetical protein